MGTPEDKKAITVKEIPEGTAAITIDLANVAENDVEEVRKNVLSYIGFLEGCKVKSNEKIIKVQRGRKNETAAFNLAFDTSTVQNLTKQGVTFIIPEED